MTDNLKTGFVVGILMIIFSVARTALILSMIWAMLVLIYLQLLRSNELKIKSMEKKK